MTENDVECSVHVNNIDPETTEDEFYDFFEQVGQVVDCFLPRDKESNKLLGFASVKFQMSPGKDVDTVIEQLNACKLKERCVRISKPSQEKNSVDAGSQIFVGNLSQDVKERDLYTIFSTSRGRVIDVPKIVRDATGKSKGYAFVRLDSVESCNDAINVHNGTYMCGLPITVHHQKKKGPNLQPGRSAYTAWQNYSTGTSVAAYPTTYAILNQNQFQQGTNLQTRPGPSIAPSTNFNPGQFQQGPNLQPGRSAYTAWQNYSMGTSDAAYPTTYANLNQNQFQQGTNLQTRPGLYIAPSTNFNPDPNLQMHAVTYIQQTSATGTSPLQPGEANPQAQELDDVWK